MRLANSGSLPSANGAKFQLNRPVDFNEYDLCERIRCEVNVPVKNNNAGTQTLAPSDITNLFAAIFGNFYLAFGEKSKEVVDQSWPSQRMREQNAAMTGRDCLVTIIGTNGGSNDGTYQLSQIPAVLTVLAGVTMQIIFELHRPFVFERLGTKMQSWCPGAYQMRTLDLSFTRNAPSAGFGSAAAFAENGPASVTVILDTQAAPQRDRYVRVPRLQISTQSGLNILGPDDGGALLALWEFTSPGASTTLTTYGLFRDDAPYHETITAKRVVRDEIDRLPLGAFDVNTLATMLFDMQDVFDFRDLLVAKKWEFKQAAADLQPPQLCWLHVPAASQAYVDNAVLATIVGTGKAQLPEAKVIGEHALRGETLPLQHASISPMAVITRDSPHWNSQAGRMLQVGKTAFTHVPDAISRSIQSLASAHPGDEEDVLARAVSVVSANIPGASAPKRGETTEAMLQVAQHVAPDKYKVNPSWQTGFAARLKALL